MTTLSTSTPITFAAPVAPRTATRVGIIGPGDVTRTRLWPALQALAPRLDSIAVRGLEPASPLAGLRHEYFRVEAGSLLPLDRLQACASLTRDTVWIIATPTPLHVPYALQLAGRCRVAVEKPLAVSGSQARALLALATADAELLPVDHKLFTADALAAVDEARLNASLLHRVRRIEATFLESTGFAPGRQPEDALADCAWHPLIILVALFRTGLPTFEITVDEVAVATHLPDPTGRFQTVPVWTASRLRGRLRGDGSEIAYEIAQAKAAPHNDKRIRLLDADDRLVREIDLTESGWRPHARIVAELLKPVPDMRHSLADAVGVMEVVDTARRLSREAPGYAVGAFPDFLAQPATA